MSDGTAKVFMRKVAEDSYLASDGRALRRESGRTPNGNPIGGRWVLRGQGGEWIDCDTYSNDLAEWHGFEFQRTPTPQGKSPAEQER